MALESSAGSYCLLHVVLLADKAVPHCADKASGNDDVDTGLRWGAASPFSSVSVLGRGSKELGRNSSDRLPDWLRYRNRPFCCKVDHDHHEVASNGWLAFPLFGEGEIEPERRASDAAKPYPAGADVVDNKRRMIVCLDVDAWIGVSLIDHRQS